MTHPRQRVPSQAVLLADNTEKLEDHFELPELSEYVVDLGSVSTVRDLTGVFGREFLFPYEAVNLDVLIDLMSDLEWLAPENGVLCILTGLDELYSSHAKLLSAMVALVLGLCDRWRDGEVPFVIALRSARSTRRFIQRTIDTENSKEEASRSLFPWLDEFIPVEVLESGRT